MITMAPTARKWQRLQLRREDAAAVPIDRSRDKDEWHEAPEGAPALLRGVDRGEDELCEEQQRAQHA